MADISEIAVAAWRLEKWLDNVNVERKMAAKSALRAIKKYLQENNIEVPIISTSFYHFLKRPGISIQFINKLVDFNYPEAVLEQVEISTKYEGYIVKTNKEIEKMLKLESKQIPKDIDYSKVTN